MATRVGEIETKGEKSEVQGDLQIPSSLVALAPLCFSLSLSSSHPCPVFAVLFPLFRKSRGRDVYKVCTIYTCMHMYMRIYMCIRVCIRSPSRRDCACDKKTICGSSSTASLEGARPLYRYR